MDANDWDRLARVYAQEVCDIFVRERRGVIAGWLRREGLLKGRKSVVDVGCGIGSFFRKYGPAFGDKTGLDHSEQMLRIAQRLCRGQEAIAWRQGDVLALPAELRRRGDLVVCSNVITFVSLPACRRAARGVAGCAKPGGRVLLVQPALESHDAVTAFRAGRPAPVRRDTAVVQRNDRRQRFFTAAGAVKLAEGAGLDDVAVRKVWYPWSDEGITRPPRGQEPPWDWLVTGRRKSTRGA